MVDMIMRVIVAILMLGLLTTVKFQRDEIKELQEYKANVENQIEVDSERVGIAFEDYVSDDAIDNLVERMLKPKDCTCSRLQCFEENSLSK